MPDSLTHPRVLALLETHERDRRPLKLDDLGAVLWGAETIAVEDVRRHARIDEALGLYLDLAGDRELSDDGEVRLKRKGVERLRSAPGGGAR